jgi:hypothetical protein
MEISFFDSNEVPLPPQEVRIRKLLVDPWSDGRRVHVLLEVDPSQKPPSADLSITDENGEEVATASIIENVARHTEINMHLRGAVSSGSFTLHAVLFFFAIDEPQAGSPPPDIEREVVDTAQTTFSLTSTES